MVRIIEDENLVQCNLLKCPCDSGGVGLISLDRMIWVIGIGDR